MSGSWIAVDWGSSTLRAWQVGPDGAPLWSERSDSGAVGLDPGGFEPMLLELLRPVLESQPHPIEVLACGMVGARRGWAEAAYRSVPCTPLDPVPVSAPVRDSRLRVHLLGGLCQAAPADVMRGEETQIAGFLAARPGFDGVLCLPGSHSKWVHLSAGEVVSFRTFMTGELFAALGAHTVLRQTLQGAGWDDAAFGAGVDEALGRPEQLAGRLFTLRAESLLNGLEPGAARARLSGLLIGAELAAARPYWLGQEVAIVGEPALCGRYGAALAGLGVTAKLLDGSDMVLKGLCAARAQLTETGT